MRHISKVAAAFIFAGTPAVMFCASGLAVPDVTVGRNLQMYASVKLPEAAPRAGLSLTVTSDDPTRLLLSKAPDQAGSASITLTVNSGFVYSPEFWVQGLADNGTVTYNVNARRSRHRQG